MNVDKKIHNLKDVLLDRADLMTALYNERQKVDAIKAEVIEKCNASISKIMRERIEKDNAISQIAMESETMVHDMDIPSNDTTLGDMCDCDADEALCALKSLVRSYKSNYNERTDKLFATIHAGYAKKQINEIAKYCAIIANIKANGNIDDDDEEEIEDLLEERDNELARVDIRFTEFRENMVDKYIDKLSNVIFDRR